MVHLRPIALGVVRRGGSILVFEGYDPVKDEHFFRPLGGGVAFGERGEDALRREFREELGAEIDVTRNLGALDNIFTYAGRPGHEICLIYEAVFRDASLYERDLLEAQEGEGDEGERFVALWRSLSDLAAGQRLYPDGLLDLILNEHPGEAGHLREEIVLLLGGTRVPWFTTMVRALDGVDHRSAARQPAPGLNSIWAVVNHVSFWHDLALRRLRAEPTTGAEATESGWSLPATGAADDWTRTQQELISRNAAVADAVGALSAAQLEEPWQPGRSSRWQVAYGLMNHTSHHTADVLIARQLLGIPPRAV